ncbi:MAG: ATP-binding protein [Thermovirgaceae bacterium]
MMHLIAERTFDADREKIGEVTAFVATHAEEAAIDARRMPHLELALEEALVNICTYAYKEPPRVVTVRILQDEKRFGVNLADEGIPFDPLEGVPKPDVDAPLEERSQGGLGVLLIRRVMDEVHYRREGGRNILSLVIRRGA